MFFGNARAQRFVNPMNGPGHAVSTGSAWAATALLVALFVAAVLAFVPSVPTRVLVLLVIAPVVEETAFRAGLHEWLLRTRVLNGALAPIANALTAVAFAGFHLAAHAELLAALTVLPALAIGAFYQRRRQLLPCIAVHAFFNGLWLFGSRALVA